MATKKKAVKKEQQWQPLTRGGYEFRIYATDGGQDWPIHGAVWRGDGWHSWTWDIKGRTMSGYICSGDLLPVKAAKKGAGRG